MDLNQLYFEHQILLMRAGHAACQRAGQMHRESARAIAVAIACLHRASGAAALQQWESR